jgi:hypothetical protein
LVIEDHERKRWPIEPPNAIDAIRYRMETAGYSHTIYDSTAASGTKIGTITSFASTVGCLIYDVAFWTGLTVVTLLAVDGADIRHGRLEDRRAKLRQLLVRPDGIRFSEHLDGDGETVFRHACKLGLEGIVSKRRDAPYRSGRSKSWLKIKNPNSPAMLRLVEDG